MRKINQILTEWTAGDIHSLKWFKERGIPQNLAYHYYKHGSLDKIGPGIYARKNEKLSWLGAVRLLQEELEKPLHVSGRTALEISGHGHYVPMGKRPNVYLTTYEGASLPKWFKETDFNCEFVFKSSKLFPREMELISYKNALAIQAEISSRELAMLEFLNQMDLRYSFEDAENYMGGLMGLRPTVVQKLLEECSSIKLKRVFLYLSEKLGHQYFAKLDLSKIDLGHGKRQIVIENTQFDKKYQITVPKEYGENPF